MRLAQLDRAFGYGPKGRGFESSSARSLEDGGNIGYISVSATFYARSFALTPIETSVNTSFAEVFVFL